MLRSLEEKRRWGRERGGEQEEREGAKVFGRGEPAQDPNSGGGVLMRRFQKPILDKLHGQGGGGGCSELTRTRRSTSRVSSLGGGKRRQKPWFGIL